MSRIDFVCETLFSFKLQIKEEAEKAAKKPDDEEVVDVTDGDEDEEFSDADDMPIALDD